MPYTRTEDAKANRRMKDRSANEIRYRQMGLEIIEDGILLCNTCMRESKLSTAHIFRHEPSCPWVDEVLRLTGRTRADLNWKRISGAVKLSLDKRKKIRYLYSLGTYSHRELGRIFGVHYTTIQKLLAETT